MKHRDIAIVLGTRPEIIKMAPVIHELGSRALIVHSGQHYDDELSGQHFTSLGLRRPDVVLTGIGGQSRSEQISRMIAGLGDVFGTHHPRAVLVQGDTNTVNAGAQTGHYLGLPVLHVEAGLRSYDRSMPEEINRLLTGTLADVHCAPTWTSAHNLIREGTDPTRIAVTGNTVVEATHRALDAPARTVASWFDGDAPDRYVVATIHRPENTDTRNALTRVLTGLGGIAVPVLFLIHPRTRAAVERFGLQHLLEPLLVRDAPNSHDFLRLAQDAAVVVSDSGGIQEEATVIKVPLAVVRRNTERPEAIDSGFAWLVTPSMDLAAEVNRMLANAKLRGFLTATASPYGDGTASERIARAALMLADGDTPSAAAAAATMLNTDAGTRR